MYGTRREPSWTPGPRVAAIAPSPCPHLTFSTATSAQFCMAGNRSHRAPENFRASRRSIPAHAGEPFRYSFYRRFSRVYPRPRGGARSGRSRPAGLSGLSPPTRGSLVATRLHRLDLRSIPAHAGEPMDRTRKEIPNKVYPRPRGGAIPTPSGGFRYSGLSPPTRGSPEIAGRPSLADGSIPAHAGEPPVRLSPLGSRTVYPRPRGGAVGRVVGRDAGPGLSPPTRGSPPLPRHRTSP